MARPSDLIQAFEYPTVKIPYEVLNQGYRNLHRDMEVKKSEVRTTCEKLLEHFSEQGNEAIPLEKIREDFLAAYRAWKRFQDSVRVAMTQMDWYTQSMLDSIARIRLEVYPKPDEIETVRWKIERDRTCRFICSYLLRCGRLRTAAMLAKKVDILPANVHELNQFQHAQTIYEALKARNTQPCLAWIGEHRQKLRKMKSKLEMAVRQQDVVALLQRGERTKALLYAKSHLKYKNFEGFTLDERKELNQIWTLLAVNVRTTIYQYASFLEEKRWNSLAEYFKEEFWRLFDLPFQSAFSLSLQCGLAAYKTPHCAPGGNSQCITCQPTVFTLADGLPHAHTGLSIIRCAYSKQLLNEDNPPWMVAKTGRVYGERSLEALTRDDKFHCVATDEWVSRKELLRLYIL